MFYNLAENLKFKTMKILKEKEYEKIMNQLKIMEADVREMGIVMSNQISTINNLINELDNLTIRRIIVGKNGSGKTYYIKNHILPQLSNYFLIDPSSEYTNVPESRRLSNCGYNPELIYESIIANKDKVIIVDNANVLYGNTKFKHKLLNVFLDRTFQGIFVFHSYKHAEWLEPFTKVVYSFGAIDGFTNQSFKNHIILKKFKA